MALLNIKKALEKHLAAMTPSIQTAYEGVSFIPTQGTPYQRVIVSPRRPENPTMGDSYHREVGTFQIFLNYPNNKGTADAIARAEMIQEHFKRGTTLTDGGYNVIVMYTPQIAGTTIIGDRLIVPVLVSYSVGVL